MLDNKIGMIGGILYLAGTVLGLFYASSYYGLFNINFLNFATPMDLFFTFFSNFEKLIHISLIEVFLILLISMAVIALLIGLLVVALVATLLIGMIVKKVVVDGLNCFICFSWLLAAAVVAPPLAVFLFLCALILFTLEMIGTWLRRIISALWPGKFNKSYNFRKEYMNARELYPAKGFDRYGKLYKRPLNSVRDAWLESKKAVIRKLPERWPGFVEWVQACLPKLRKFVPAWDTFKRCSKEWITICLLVTMSLAVLVANRYGHFDAECIIDKRSNCEGGLFEPGYIFNVGYSVIKDVRAWVEYTVERVRMTLFGGGADGTRNVRANSRATENRVGQRMAAFVVPTENLVSLRFLPGCHCSGSNAGQPQPSAQANERVCDCPRKYVRATIRQDAYAASPDNFPDCLVYVGGTKSAQFLVQMIDEDAHPLCEQEDGANENLPLEEDCENKGCENKHDDASSSSECKENSGSESKNGACKPELVALVGPFGKGTTKISTTGNTESCQAFPNGASYVNMEELFGKIRSRLQSSSKDLSHLHLIGRTDSLPINNMEFRSNSGLAQARARWVWDDLRGRLEGLKKKEWVDSLHVMATSAGPHAPGVEHDRCDRVVEVRACWESDGGGA